MEALFGLTVGCPRAYWRPPPPVARKISREQVPDFRKPFGRRPTVCWAAGNLPEDKCLSSSSLLCLSRQDRKHGTIHHIRLHDVASKKSATEGCLPWISYNCENCIRIATAARSPQRFRPKHKCSHPPTHTVQTKLHTTPPL